MTKKVDTAADSAAAIKKPVKKATDAVPAAVEPTPEPTPPAAKYSVKKLEEFRATVFHTVPKGASPLLFAKKSGAGGGGLPMSIDAGIKALAKARASFGCYTSIASVYPDEKDDRLYCRKANFAGLHVVVLDDIGTKIPRDKMPKDLDPTYKITSSKGNEQWGFVLEAPITDQRHADVLIRACMGSGYSDKGGMLTTKQVRVPAGVNGKAGAGEHFEVKALDMAGPYWTPQDLLDILGVPLDWSKVEANDEAVIAEWSSGGRKRKAFYGRGEAAVPEYLCADGFGDPLLEWLNKGGYILQEGDEFFDVKCPWSAGHTQGDDTAGFSPLGFGAPSQKIFRGFHCFHEHCQGKKATDFLAWVAEQGGPLCAVRDPFAYLACDHVYVGGMEDAAAWIPAKHAPIVPTKLSVINNKNPGQIYFPAPSGGKPHRENAKAAWLANPFTQQVDGYCYKASNSIERIVSYGAERRLNTFMLPSWAYLPPPKCDMGKIAPFLTLLDFLCPIEEEREYLLDWMASKVQNIEFRGLAILFVADVSEGLGRSSLMKWYGRLFDDKTAPRNPGEGNVVTIDLDAMIKSDFNEHDRAQLRIVNEVGTAGSATWESDYEKLKTQIDTAADFTHLNAKHKGAEQVWNTSQTMSATNSVAALKLTDDARRFYLITNPRDVDQVTDAGRAVQAERVAMIKEFGDRTGWEPHLWRYLLDRVVTQDMTTPPKATAGLIEMASKSLNVYEKIAAALFVEFSESSGVVPVWSQVTDIVKEVYWKTHTKDADPAAMRHAGEGWRRKIKRYCHPRPRNKDRARIDGVLVSFGVMRQVMEDGRTVGDAIPASYAAWDHMPPPLQDAFREDLEAVKAKEFIGVLSDTIQGEHDD